VKEVGLRLNEKGLIPAIIQDEASGKLLMMAWMNLDTLRMTKETGYTHFYSRSRNEVWKKGETSGNTQKVKKIFYDCDADTILITVDPAGPACHTGKETCFFSELAPEDSIVDESPEKAAENMLSKVYQVIQQRKRERPEGSYVAGLFEKGESTILKKIGEESTELVIACKNGKEDEIVYEAADLWFHTLVAMAQHDVPPEKIFEELRKRFK